jgi:hypothetical protein
MQKEGDNNAYIWGLPRDHNGKETPKGLPRVI